ncbi:Os07g0196700 [Oryza sativa Japonica Group]|uniref:Os07g0196700 protein n=1 Tax=Oryza sativa subsp. japonica TaxID=39947 RepID=Q6Z395_ORYSJ|nr:hypothetical protein [Oryza sativa Japonica Group]BAD30689.1 hypothetical protein [Oryza sativa Japonica Group]BAF21035.1 Os07g0196700 [Oryza sativa Japonica Group]|eukprot:NP_001059121.1 Os07g0196700 [Oryza sativa Japonica Group]
MRTFSPREVEDQFHIYRLKDEIAAVVATIDKIYSHLQLDKGSLEKKNGFCFGLLDPVTNILINSAISELSPATAAQAVVGGGGEKAKDLNNNAAPRVEAGGGSRKRRRRGDNAADLSQRSLDGLTAFLTCLFPYLPDAEARLYLDAADADPIVASLLIIRRRGIREFDLSSQPTEAAVEVALRCAAVAAKHPDPRSLVLGWKLLSPVVEALFGSAPSSPRETTMHGDVARRVLRRLHKDNAAADPVLRLEGSWELAKRRLKRERLMGIYAGPKWLPPARAHMKRVLLATIHGFYLQAMGRLPTSELCDSFHRSMLMGGHCYGPLDPVSNIIVNTICFQWAMISTTMLSCIVARSLYGLVSFLCTRYRGLTPDLAMQRLLVTGVNLKAADPNLSPTPSATSRKKRLDFSDCAQVLDNPDTSHIQHSVVEESTPSAGVDESYIAAATAGFHGYPLAQQEFLASPTGLLSKLELVSEVLHIQVCVPGSQSASDGPLSPQKLSLLRTILQRCPSSTGKLHQQQDVACRKEDHPFELHFICGVNELVSGPVRSLGEKVGDYNPWTRDKYYHTHINFLAVCKARLYDPPTLFFAECGKDGADTCWCVPVIPQKPEAGQVRCIYCEYQGNRILHPTMESFHGRDEFEKLFYGSNGSYTNDKLITNSDLEVDWVHGVQDGAIYRDCCPDSDDDEDDWIDIF